MGSKALGSHLQRKAVGIEAKKPLAKAMVQASVRPLASQPVRRCDTRQRQPKSMAMHEVRGYWHKARTDV